MTKMEIGFLITARLKSTRLPKKVILEIDGRPIISHMIDRLKQSKILDRIILCTSTNPQDKPLVDIAASENIDCFVGSEDDVILRLYEASRKFKLDYALNVTADNPLVSLEFLGEIANKYKETNADFIRCPELPIGLGSYGLKIDAMRKVCEIKKSQATEVWGRYFTDTGLFNVVDIDISPEYIRPDYRLTLDYPEDFEFFQKIFEHFGENTCKASTLDIIKYLDENQKVVEINKHCQELYKKRWESAGELARWEI
ncbi:cytidylyltransferase domain-containing protein [Chloroflexota bacterium]